MIGAKGYLKQPICLQGLPQSSRDDDLERKTTLNTMLTRTIFTLAVTLAVHKPAFAQVTVYQPVVPVINPPGQVVPVVSTTVVPVATGTDGFTTYLEQRISVGTTAAPSGTPTALGPGFNFLAAPTGNFVFAEDGSAFVHTEVIPQGAFTIVDTVSCSFLPEATAAVCVDESELRAAAGTNSAAQTVTLPLTAVATFTPAVPRDDAQSTGGLSSRSVDSGAAGLRPCGFAVRVLGMLVFGAAAMVIAL